MLCSNIFFSQLILTFVEYFKSEVVFYFADNHDIISMKLYQLMVEHTPEEENLDWTKIEPSVSLLKSPKGTFFLCLCAADSCGRRHYGFELSASTL